MEHRLARTNRGRIEYTIQGDGPLVLVCHGTSADCFSHDGYQPLLEAGLSLLTPSRPGYGRTPLEVGVTAHAAAGALLALLDCLEVEKCAVMGISGGGPTAIALAAGWPERIQRLALLAAITHPEERANEPAYQNQLAFYGPMHPVIWSMLRISSRLFPHRMARQTLEIFSTHDPEEALRCLTPAEINQLSSFYQRPSSRKGALSDLAHTVGKELLGSVPARTLVIHSREDKSVPFSHAEWSLAHIHAAELCESGFCGHFYWIGPDSLRVSRRLIGFLKDGAAAIPAPVREIDPV